jgi:hypothetical protein
LMTPDPDRCRVAARRKTPTNGNLRRCSPAP